MNCVRKRIYSFLKAIKKGSISLSLIILPLVLSASAYGQTDTKKNMNKSFEIPVLLLHHLDENIEPSQAGTIITPKEFEETLKVLSEEGYSTISISELKETLSSGYTNYKKPIAITFDDGYLSNYKYAYPLLKKYNMKASIFIVTDTVGKTPGKYPHFSWKHAKEMEKSGHIEIYNHTQRHKTLDELPENEYIESVLNAQKDIDENLGKRKIKAFAYPQGIHNEKVYDKLKEKGYDLQFTVIPGHNRPEDKGNGIKRINVSHGQGGGNILSLINENNK